jgi:pimeloyl-ACP methyl ester carboxylesterase
MTPGQRPHRARILLAVLGLAGLGASAVVTDLHPGSYAAQVALLALVVASEIAVALGGLLLVATATMALRGRRWRIGSLALVAALGLVGLAGYTGYVGTIGSDQLLHPTPNTDCRTPLSRFGWAYEAMNYDVADDVALQGLNSDPERCAGQGAKAGDEIVTSDGVGIAGWYIPAANGSGPTGPTIVLVHGWGANKSEVVKYAVPLHPTFNVVAFDLRGGGRSGAAETTFGLREQLDIEAVIDWLERTKKPTHIAVMGNSMGGGSAVLAAATDPRIEALILDSTHAYVANILERRLEVDAGHPAMPGTPAILAGIWVRTGLDLMAADPAATIPALGHRPLLLLHGAADAHDIPARSADVIFRVATDAGVPVERHYCPGATHGKVIDTCPTDWGAWAVDFLDRAFAPTHASGPSLGSTAARQ